MEEKKPTAFEWALYGWLCLNVAIGIHVIGGGVVIYGSGWRVWTLLPIGLISAGLLIWRLLKPTWITLGLAAVFYLFQVVEVRLPDGLYAFQLGLTVKYRVFDDPDLVVRINLLAIVTAWLFGLAAYRRFEEEGP
ncbi:hypothetical protein [Dyella sp. 2RAB6]|uniref:hypothetical protein n=1 Tax=Dyella sp. 2RAB6 TaxID=3232992 RepID=UPI003F90BE48